MKNEVKILLIEMFLIIAIAVIGILKYPERGLNLAFVSKMVICVSLAYIMINFIKSLINSLINRFTVNHSVLQPKKYAYYLIYALFSFFIMLFTFYALSFWVDYSVSKQTVVLLAAELTVIHMFIVIIIESVTRRLPTDCAIVHSEEIKIILDSSDIENENGSNVFINNAIQPKFMQKVEITDAGKEHR